MSTLNTIRINNVARREEAFAEALHQYRLAVDTINQEEYALIRDVLEEAKDTPKTAAEIARVTDLSVHEVAGNLCAMSNGNSRYKNKITEVPEERDWREDACSYAARLKKNRLPRVEIHQKKIAHKFAEIDEQTGKVLANGRTFTQTETKNIYLYIK